MIFTVRWNFDVTILKVCKIHRKQGLNKRQLCFANISVNEAQIFMKFETKDQKILETYQKMCVRTTKSVHA